MNAFDELKLKVYESGLNWDEKENIVNLMESCEEEDLQEVCESVEEFITEGTTTDMNKIFDEFKQEVPKIIRESKVDYKNKKYSDAINKLERAKSITEKTNAKLKTLDADKLGAIVCGNIYQNFATGVKGILIALSLFIIGVGPNINSSIDIGAGVASINNAIEVVSGIINELKDKKKLTPAMLNSRYMAITNSVKSTMNHIDKTIELIKIDMKYAKEE